VPTHSHQTRQLNLWGFQRLTFTGGEKNLWFHPYFIRGHADGLEHIKRVEVRTSDTSKRGPPERRQTVDTSQMKRVSALSITSPKEMSTGRAKSIANSLATSRLNTGHDSDVALNVSSDPKKSEPEPMLVQVLDQQPPEAIMSGSDALLFRALQEKNQLLTQKIARLRTQKIVRLRDKIMSRLIDERIQNAARPMSPTPCPPGRIIRAEEQRRQSEALMSSSPLPPEHDSRDPKHQGNEGAPAFHVTAPAFVHPSPVAFADNAPVQENAPYHSFSSSSSWPSRGCAPLSNVGQGTILHRRHIQPPAPNYDADDEFKHLVSQIFEPSQDSLSSNELEEEFVNTISF
jgi:hypothetical protein